MVLITKKEKLMKKIKILILVISVVGLIISCSSEAKQVLAKVDGKEITMEDLNDEIENLPAQYRFYAQSPEMKKRILDNLILTEVLMKEAEKQGMLSNNEIISKIKEQELSMKKDIESQIISLKKRLEKVSKTAKRDVVINSLINNKDFKEIQVSDEEISKLYNQYSSNMKMQNPGAKVESLNTLKEDIRKSIARDKWFNELKSKSKITVDENAFASNLPPPSNLKIMPEEKAKNNKK